MGLWVLAAISSGLSQGFWSLLVARVFVGAGKERHMLLPDVNLTGTNAQLCRY
jgi:hypothetical protein